MGLFNILSYLNKLSLLAFFVTAVVLIYQVIIIKKENSGKKNTPVIPDFNENMATPQKNYTVINEEKKTPLVKPKDSKITLILIIGAVITVLLLVYFLVNRFAKTNTETLNLNTPTLYPTKIVPTAPIITTLTPLPGKVLRSTPTPKISLSSTVTLIPTIIPTKSPTVTSEPVIAYTTSSSLSPTKTTVLPETGEVGRGVFIMAVSGLILLFSFVF